MHCIHSAFAFFGKCLKSNFNKSILNVKQCKPNENICEAIDSQIRNCKKKLLEGVAFSFG